MTDETTGAARGLRERIRARRTKAKERKLAKPLPSRDSVEDGNEAVRFRDLVIRSGFATIPLIGVLMFVVKLEIQTHGDVNLAIAIAENTALSTVAFVLLVSLLPYMTAGIAAGAAQVHFNLEFSGGVRRVAGWACWVAVIILFISQPWWFLAIALAYIAIERATEGREPRRVLPMEQWIQTPAPEDKELRGYWSALRNLYRNAGKAVTAQRGDVATPELASQSWMDLSNAVVNRYSAINATRRKTPMSAIYMSIVAVFTAFGVTLITGPIHLAPTEHVVFQDGSSMNGYVFSNSSDQSLFVDANMVTTRYIAQANITSRALCTPAINLLEKTLVGLFAAAPNQCPSESGRTASRSSTAG